MIAISQHGDRTPKQARDGSPAPAGGGAMYTDFKEEEKGALVYQEGKTLHVRKGWWDMGFYFVPAMQLLLNNPKKVTCRFCQ